MAELTYREKNMKTGVLDRFRLNEATKEEILKVCKEIIRENEL